MKIHTLDDTAYELNALPEEISDMRFAILDNSDSTDPDFKYIPLIFLETFTCTALVLRIGEHKIVLPLGDHKEWWEIVIGEDEIGDLEALPLSSINDRDFKAFQFNSLSSFKPSFEAIEILDVYSEVTWYAPKLKNGQFLAVPLDDSDKPKCIYIAKNVSRNCEVIDYNKLW